MKQLSRFEEISERNSGFPRRHSFLGLFFFVNIDEAKVDELEEVSENGYIADIYTEAELGYSDGLYHGGGLNFLPPSGGIFMRKKPTSVSMKGCRWAYAISAAD